MYFTIFSGRTPMYRAVEGAFVWVLIAVTILPLVLWGLNRARRNLEKSLRIRTAREIDEDEVKALFNEWTGRR
jgi:hypothetical protein